MKKPRVLKIGKKLKQIRKSCGYTQEKLAEKIECSARYVSDIEQDNARPSYEVLVKICNLFHVGIDNVFDEYLENNEKNYMEVYGFSKLSKKDKQTILHMIQYLNQSNADIT